MAHITADARNKLQSSQFGLPSQRKYPLDTRARAANAKARATQMVAKGKLSSAAASQIKAKANRKLTGVSADLNKPGNTSPQTPLQEDINPVKSRPVTTRSKWMNNSQARGVAADTGAASTSKKNQPKHGGTEVAGANKKGQPKISPNTTQAPVAVAKKGQQKFGGTANPQGRAPGTRYANGSSSHDAMKSMIRDH